MQQNDEKTSMKKDKKKKMNKNKKDQQDESGDTWESGLLDSKVKQYDFVTHAAILDLEGHVKAVIPADFVLDNHGI